MGFHRRLCTEFTNYTVPTLSLLAVPGSIMLLTSLTSWLTLGPTSPAPIRMTMLFGVLFKEALLVGPFVAPLRAPTCVRFFVRRLAIVL